MSYRWHSQRQGSFDAIRLTWIAGEASWKTATGRELSQSVAGKRKVYSGKARDGLRHDGKSAKGPREREQE